MFSNLVMPFVRLIVPACVRFRVHIALAKVRQFLILARIRRKVGKGEKIKIVFIVSEIAKWKCQSLYDLLKTDGRYESIIGLTYQDAERNVGDSANMLAGIERAEKFFSLRGAKTMRLYDVDKGEAIGIDRTNADVVFYQQPWNVDDNLSPELVSKYALPCYVPYFVPNYSYDALTYGLMFHQFLRYYFVLDQEAVSRGLSLHHYCNFSGKCVSVGHPMLDDFYLNPIKPSTKPCVIYAPHFTFSHPNNPVIVHYSTFLDNGEWILEYAKAHPEMNWVFKPHPVLKTALKRSKAWSEEKIERYYSEWGRIGRVCENGDYMSLFREATAMITDCGSFLSEFGATKKPIIHLINPENNLEIPDLYDTYYKVHNLDELTDTLHEVLEKGNDYKRDTRIKAVVKSNLSGQYAAKNIMDFFDKEFKVKR